ncbi:MAG: tetratricopeptide repeat protein, partial [Longimicrobiales bacterium]
LRFPDDPRLYRHRGHRFLSVRDTDSAIADFTRAAELIEGQNDVVEPDGLPNDRGIPTSTLHFNIWYHLGLAHFIAGDFDQAILAYERCLEVSTNPDALVATSYWMYMTERLLGRGDQAAALLAPITDDLDIIENDAYRQLLLLFKGERTAEQILPDGPESLAQATTLYGIANWHRFEGRDEEALRTLERLVAVKAQWPSFGYLAAEADLARLRDGDVVP